ncbi:methyl-accepting chemotaxis protein [Pseudanabaena sp. lw0831]|uniref:methyl-accepting chemotaxis protein n=1 Tax=Pseudanabaena sp. lw0831 TaxID=1357935 RepID=UPI001A1C5CB0|nr:methyl-accepting chemotaxis protein [Pseudanabaena sp. lw0831]GBO53196.1 methyl-accepting chemotaxis protein [Pseudanabaena sp. lw0831]
MLANKESVLTDPKPSIPVILEPVMERTGEDRKIIRGLTTFVGVGLVIFGISALNLFDIYRGFRSISEKNFRLQELSGKIVYFDEVLTMSARMSASTGDPRWEKRYLEYDPQLVAALEESAKIAPDAYKNLPTEVNDANTKLVDLEKKSFELVRQGKKIEASQILFGAEYEAQKKIYADGSSKTLVAIENETQGQLQSFSQRLTVSLIFTLLTLPALIGAYLIALKLIRAYLSDRDRAQKNIASLLIQQAETDKERARLELQQATSEQERARMQLEQSIATQDSERSAVLQRELIALLSDVEGAASGDLTVRAQISAGEIGIVADFFNSIIESLRDVVRQVKQSAGLVNTSVDTNNQSIRNLAEDAISQAQQLEEALQSVEQMTNSIQQVSSSAQQAANASIAAADNAETGSVAIEQSVKSILQLRLTVAETAKKVKRLGEASQQISKIVVLIDQIALKTNMLAVNASIEASLAGEEGRGFAVVAEEVGALAAQSAKAAKEIEILVETIQKETSEVVQAMEASTVQVVEGTNRVEDARKSLNQIVQVSRQVNQLFQEISIATTSQVQTSQSVKLVMENLSTQSQKSSETSRDVAISLQETADVASKLQASVETFKVDIA